MFSVLATLLSVSLPMLASAQLSGMTIAPLMFRDLVGAGGKVNLTIQIQNLQQDSLNVTADVVAVTFEDWTYLPKFGNVTENDCSSWISPAQTTQVIPAAAQGNINLSAKIPHVHPGVYWCMARVSPHYQNDPSTIGAQYQIPIILFVGGQPKQALKLDSPEMVQKGTSEEVDVPFENTGDGFTVIGANVELRQASTGRLLNNFYDYDRNLYPRTKRNITFSAGELPEGEYIVTSKPEAGTRSFSPMTRRFAVTKGGIKPDTGPEAFDLSPITFDPGAVHVQMPSGGERSAVLRVTNNSAAPVNVKIAVKAISQDPDGAFSVGSTPPAGPFTISSEPDALQLDPGRTGAVRLAIGSSKDAAGDYWFAIEATTDDVHEISEQIYGNLSIPNGAPNLQLRKTDIKKIGQYPYSVLFEIANTGNLSLKPIAFAQVLEEGLQPIANLTVPTLGGGGVLPGSVLRNEVLLPPNLKPGTYSVNIKYQYGQDLFATLTVPILVPGSKPKPKGGR
jgi:archaellum component FlaG (FlaF/FlaG flagellin family)